MTITYGEARSGRNWYVANGVIPDSVVPVVIQASTTVPNIQPGDTAIHVDHASDCVIVTLDKDTIAPGEAVTFHFAKRKYTGEIVPFSPDQLFDVYTDWMNNGYLKGMNGEIDWDELDCTPQGVKFVAADTISVDSVRVEFYVYAADWCGVNGEYADLCGDTYPSVWIKKNVRLVITDPDPAALQVDKSITSVPVMPSLQPKARLLNYTGGQVDFSWKFRVIWVAPDRKEWNGTFTGITSSQNSDVSTWTIDWANSIHGGDIDTVVVTAMAGGKEYEAKAANPYRIIGMNPSKYIIKAELTLEGQVVCYKESSPKWHHFINDNDFPVVSGDGGYGLMQLTPPGNTEQVWDWRANIAEGQSRLNEKYDEASTCGSRIRRGVASRNLYHGVKYENVTDLTTVEQLWKEAFQRYNGGVYWFWRPDDEGDENSTGAWEPYEERGDYGDDAWRIYTDVQNGSSPQGW